MSAIFSSGYHSNSFVPTSKTASGKSTFGGAADSSSAASSQTSSADVLTISSEGAQAANSLIQATNCGTPQIDFEGLGLKTGQKDTMYLLADPEKHSKHQSVLHWALDTEPLADDFYGFDMADVRGKIMIETVKLDTMISDKLKSLGITLKKDERLDFTINQDGEIKIDEKYIPDKEKRAAIEAAFNEDSTLAMQLKYTHALRTFQPGIGHDSDQANKILVDVLLQREYGVSLSDFRMEYVTDGELWHADKIAYTGNVPGLLTELYNEERLLLKRAVDFNNEFFEDPLEYEFTFSYKNGVTIEKNESDLASLSKTIDEIDLDLYGNVITFTDYKMTLDGTGTYVSSNVSRVIFDRFVDTEGAPIEQANSSLQRLYSGQKGDDYYESRSTLREKFSFDAKRLLQYEFGEEADQYDDIKFNIEKRAYQRTLVQIVAVKTNEKTGETESETLGDDVKATTQPEPPVETNEQQEPEKKDLNLNLPFFENESNSQLELLAKGMKQTNEEQVDDTTSEADAKTDDATSSASETIKSGNTSQAVAERTKVEFEDAGLLKKIGDAMGDMTPDLYKMILEAQISRAVEKCGVTLRDGDRLAMAVDREGTFSINPKASKLGGRKGEEIEEVCGEITTELNQTRIGENSLGEAFLDFYAKQRGIDLEEARKDEDFKISFTFRFNKQSGRNEMFGLGSNSELEKQLLQNMDSDDSEKRSDEKTEPQQENAITNTKPKALR